MKLILISLLIVASHAYIDVNEDCEAGMWENCPVDTFAECFTCAEEFCGFTKEENECTD